ncbi:MAG: 4Fe-4S binding protein [Cellulosilyticaceae bacterium]
MTIKEIYNKFDQIGCLTFSTQDDQMIESRIAHFFACDDEGLYFRTMNTKPFYKQLTKYKNISVCGMYPNTKVTHDENQLPYFEPGYTIRISGKTRELTAEEISEKAANNSDFYVAVYDIKKYPATKIFVLDKAKGEYYDYDFEKKYRDHKLERKRFSYGGMNVDKAGLMITNSCIGCGQCLKKCTFDAIESGKPYVILGNRCDECGTCYTICPVKAIQTKGM